MDDFPMKPDNTLPLDNVDFQIEQMKLMLSDLLTRGNIPDFINPQLLVAASLVYFDWVKKHKLSVYADTTAHKNITVEEFNAWFNDNSFLLVGTWLGSWVSYHAYMIEQDD